MCAGAASSSGSAQVLGGQGGVAASSLAHHLLQRLWRPLLRPPHYSSGVHPLHHLLPAPPSLPTRHHIKPVHAETEPQLYHETDFESTSSSLPFTLHPISLSPSKILCLGQGCLILAIMLSTNPIVAEEQA